MGSSFLENLSITILIEILFGLIILSALFSSSETSMMSLNRYRLRHLAKSNRRAKKAAALLKRPDRLLGVILIGNNFVNILASSIATIIGIKLAGDQGVLVAAAVLTIVILIFGEVMPKTLAANKPEHIAFSAAYPLQIILYLLFPIVWLINSIANGLLYLFGMGSKPSRIEGLSMDELRTVLKEASPLIPSKHKAMLSSIIDLEKFTVEDIMVPKSEVFGIDLESSTDPIQTQIKNAHHTLLPVFRNNLNDIEGILHCRDVCKVIIDGVLDLEKLLTIIERPYFVPEGVTCYQQLINFQKQQRRLGIVVNEYGEVLGLITLADILEEIVGEFTTDTLAMLPEIFPQPDGSYIVDGGIQLRALNRAMKWKLPLNGAKTLNGLIIDYLETIPDPATCVLLHGHPVEILQIQDNMIKSVKIYAEE